MSFTLTFWGTSNAQGVPRFLCKCSVCQTRTPIHTRKRPSVRLQTEQEDVLVDLSPDFRQQFLLYGNDHIPTTVLITHCHNDHIAGLGDYADLCFWNKKTAKIVSPAENIEMLKVRYPYLQTGRGIEFIPSSSWALQDWSVRFHKVNHGHNGYAYGILFQGKYGKWAYMPDAFDLTDEQLKPFYGCHLLILGASYFRETAPRNKRSVYDVTEAIALKRTLEAKCLLLTHLSHDINIPEHSQSLPKDVYFAYDGLVLSPSPQWGFPGKG